MPNNRPGWLKAWTVDLNACEARHKSGLVFRFVEDDLGWEAEPVNLDEITPKLTAAHGFNATMQMLRRMMLEAADAYDKALTARH